MSFFAWGLVYPDKLYLKSSLSWAWFAYLQPWEKPLSLLNFIGSSVANWWYVFILLSSFLRVCVTAAKHSSNPPSMWWPYFPIASQDTWSDKFQWTYGDNGMECLKSKLLQKCIDTTLTKTSTVQILSMSERLLQHPRECHVSPQPLSFFAPFRIL